MAAALCLPILQKRINLLACYTADHSEVLRMMDEVRRLSNTYSQEARKRRKTVTSKQVGDALESLLSFVFSSTSGLLSPIGSQTTAVSQLDNVVTVQHLAETFLACWHPFFLVECKNYSKPVSKKMASDFVAEVQRAAGCSVGIIVARRNVTLGAKILFAIEAGQKAEVHRTYILVMTDTDLDKLASGDNLFDVLEFIWIQRCISPA